MKYQIFSKKSYLQFKIKVICKNYISQITYVAYIKYDISHKTSFAKNDVVLRLVTKSETNEINMTLFLKTQLSFFYLYY